MSNTINRVGIYGGSFDPFHLGHFHIIETALRELPIKDLWLLPNYLNPFKVCAMFDASMRLQMCERVAQAFQSQGFNVYVCDFEIKQNRAVYTIESIEYLKEILRLESKPFFLLGEDSFATLSQWRESQRLTQMLDLVVVERAVSASPYPSPLAYSKLTLPTCLRDLSSTHLRQLLQQGYLDEALEQIPSCLHSFLRQNFVH